MTEELSTLNRSQLQKLLQYAVQLDPAGVLGKVFQHIGQFHLCLSLSVCLSLCVSVYVVISL